MDQADLDRYEESMRRFSHFVENLSSNMGRGSDSHSPIPKSKSTLADDTKEVSEEMKKLLAQIKKLEDKYKLELVLSEQEFKQIKSLKEQVKELEEAEKEHAKTLKEQKEQYKRLGRGVKDFGLGLVSGTNSMSQLFGSLSSTLSWGDGKLNRVIGGVAGGFAFMLNAIEGIAKDAMELGGFADLDAFKVGSIRQAKVLSGLGDSFSKVIEGSVGGFKAFGTNSQEAVERLSELSRGFRVGSSYISTELAKNLGPDLVKTLDQAQKSTAALGLSQQDQAAVMGSLSQTISLTAKSEKEAQQMMVKQYEQTVKSARTLSDTFGVSAKEIIKAMEAFRKTSGGQTAALMGLDVEGANIAGLIGQFKLNVDDETKGRMAAAIVQGDYASARYMVKDEDQQSWNLVEKALQSASGMQGGLKNAENIQKAARAQIPALKEQFEERKRLQVAPEWSAAGQRAGSVAATMELQMAAEKGDKKAKEKLEKMNQTTESANITAQNKVTQALNELRGVMMALTAGVLALVGPLGAIAVAGGIGGILGGSGGLLGGLGEKLGGWLSKIPGMGKLGKIGEGAWGAAKKGGSAAIDTLAGAADKGLKGFGEMLKNLGDTKTMKGAATIAILGVALIAAAYGFKAFADVKWQDVVLGTFALAGLVFLAKELGKKSTDVLKGAFAVTILSLSLWVAGKGLQQFVDLDWKGLLTGGIALTIFAAAIYGLGTLLMGGGLAPFLAGVAAIMAIGAAAAVAGWGLGIFAESLKAMSEIDGVNLMLVGAGLAAIGIGMSIFAFGMLAGTASGVISGIASLFGVKSPLDKVKEFVPLADKIAMIGEGIKNFGAGIISINKGVSAFDKDAFSTLKTSMQEFAVVGSSEEMRLTAEYLKTIGTSLGNISQISSLPTTSALSGISGLNTTGIPGQENAKFGMNPDMIATIMGYLSNIQSDIAAIRGNTRPADSSAPVRF